MATIEAAKAQTVFDLAEKLLTLYDRGEVEEALALLDGEFREALAKADESRLNVMTRRIGQLIEEQGLKMSAVYDDAKQEWVLSDGRIRVGVRTVQTARRTLAKWPRT
ncbi:MAG TPA: hypothetical protein VFA38_01875 [Nitrospirales bacterium]|nr:hypothetical protein [Nitrospirales bacterium]